MIKFFSMIPWTLLLILYMVVVHVTGLDMNGVLGYTFMVLCIVVLFLEFFKSGDIKPLPFLVDIITSVAALILTTVLMSYLIFQGAWPTFFDWFGAAIIIGDSVLSPYNSFRTALRNLNVGDGI